MDMKEILNKFESKAREVFEDRDKLEELLLSVKEAVENNESLKNIIEEIQLFIDMLKDFIDGNYSEISDGSVVLVIIGLLYVVSPIDLIPDFLLGGHLDDLLVIMFILKIISDEVDDYRRWKYDEDDTIYEIESSESNVNEEIRREIEEDDLEVDPDELEDLVYEISYDLGDGE